MKAKLPKPVPHSHSLVGRSALIKLDTPNKYGCDSTFGNPWVTGTPLFFNTAIIWFTYIDSQAKLRTNLISNQNAICIIHSEV